MATKPAQRRVRLKTSLLIVSDIELALGPLSDALPSTAHERVCRHAEGVPTIRLGGPRREEHLELCVGFVYWSKGDPDIFSLQGTSLSYERLFHARV